MRYIPWILWIALCHCTPSDGDRSIRELTTPFNVDALVELVPYKSDALAITSRYIILIYLTEVSCGACSDRELISISKEYQNRGYPFLLVAGPSKSFYLRNMKRVLKLQFPMALEAYGGQLGLPSKFNISLIDIEKRMVTLRYIPEPGPDSTSQLHRFLTKAEKIMNRNP